MTIAVPASQWRLSTAGGIPLRVVSRTGSFSEEGASATEVYIIKASQLLAFALESFPLPYVFLGTVFYPPRRRMPNMAPLATKRVSWEALVPGKPIDPFGADSGAPSGTYDEDIQVTIEYGTTAANDSDPDPNDPKTFLEVSANATAKLFNAPVRGNATWVGEGAEADEEVREQLVPHTQPQPIVEWTIRWSQIPMAFFNSTIKARLNDAMGKVNSAAMPLLFVTLADTVLLESWTMQEQYTWRTGLAGQPPIQIELKMQEKNFEWVDAAVPAGIRVTHQYAYRAGKGFRKILLDGTTSLCQQTDLNSLFAP